MKTAWTALALVSLLAAATPSFADPGTPASERLVVSFDRLPDGVAPHGRFLDADVVATDQALGFAVVQAADGADFRHQAAGRFDVRRVEAESLQPLALSTPNDPEFAVSQYGPQLVGAPAAWDAVPAGTPAPPICFLDSGVRYTHADLAARWAGGIDLVNGDADPMDDRGHGTHVAGIAAAVTSNGIGIAGVAPSPILAVKVLDAAGSGYLSTVASGIRWCADHGAKVVSMSLGSATGASYLQDAVAYAAGKGVLMVAAAGNGNGCADCVLYPARYPDVAAVGCVDQYRNPCAFASTGPEVDLAAPGNAIQSTWWTSDTAYMRAAGTSMSTPHVAGAAALVWLAHPDYTAAQVRQALESSAQDVAAAGKDVQTGAGLVRADLAIAAAVQAPAPPPMPPAAGLSISPASQAKSVAAKGTITYTFQVQNTGEAQDTVQLSVAASRNGWTATLGSGSLTLEPGATGSVTLWVKAPQKSGPMTATLTAQSTADALVKATATAQTTIAK